MPFQSEGKKDLCIYFCFRSQDQLTRGYLCVKIGVDLLVAVPSAYETNDRSVLMLRTIEVFVVALAVYDQLLKKRSKAESKVDENVHHFALRDKKKLIYDWLNTYTFYPSMETHLKVNIKFHMLTNDFTKQQFVLG